MRQPASIYSPNKTKAGKDGFVLVIVLAMILLLTALLLIFSRTAESELTAARDFRSHYQAFLCAQSGLNIAAEAIADTCDIELSSDWSESFSGDTCMEFDNGTCRVEITDESGKLNLNRLKDTNGRLVRRRIDHLLRLVDMLRQKEASTEADSFTYDIAAGIIDWTDSDDNITCLPFVKQGNIGAESNYYKKHRPAYQAKNAPLSELEELLLIKGVNQKLYKSIRLYVTVHGGAKVNINTASELVIRSLSENIDSSLAEMIIQYRKNRPFETTSQLLDVPGVTEVVYEDVKPWVSVRSELHYYTINSVGKAGNFTCRIRAKVRKQPSSDKVAIIYYNES